MKVMATVVECVDDNDEQVFAITQMDKAVSIDMNVDFFPESWTEIARCVEMALLLMGHDYKEIDELQTGE